MTDNMTADIPMGDGRKKLFTHAELENIVEQRLSRERKNNESLIKIRDILSILRQKEAFKKLSNASLADKLEELEKGICDAENTSADVPTDQKVHPDTNDEKSTRGGNADAEEPGIGVNEAFYDEGERRIRELSEFLTIYGEEKLEEVLSDSAFRFFSRGKRGDLLSLYEDYLGFIEGLSSSPGVKRYRAAQRELASTGFSGGASCVTDYGSVLSENQRRIAKAAGMSFRQYAELISQIPSKKF